ncbi:serine/threonine-protein kinase ATR isoform X3 [Ooceraea biroi]|uniref:serine/threonine-protein kinase ATR isoform X3 n=1 Tax=Ooceraea biroi TaxID=2015173 RepID=UPI0005BD751F|nr:serine/threonine-protein kinase ATR isoform X3 [Ooceraea biroi]
MEVNNDSATPQDNSTITVADSVWRFINSPIIAIFSDLENPATEQMLCSLLESLLKRSSTLTTVLVPPFVGTVDETLQQQYAAFTTWLFGTMFHLLCVPSSDVILSNSIEVQACMLRILSRHHMMMFETISLEYLNILDEISEFYLNSEETEEITLSKFHTEKNIIQNLDLTPFPATIKSSSVPAVLTSLFKVIMKTGVSAWNQRVLWDKTVMILVKSSPDFKIEALRLCTEIMQYCLIEDRDLMIITTYSLEIVKSLPAWINSFHLPAHLLSQFAETLTRLIQLLPVSFKVVELCFEVINFIASECSVHDVKAEATKKLMETTCCKIKQYLIVEPKSCTISDAQRLLACSVWCPAVIDIFMQYVLFDIRRAVAQNKVILATEISESWKLLRKKLMSLVQAEKFTEVLHIAQASSSLQCYLEKESIEVRLYENDLNVMLKILIQNLNSEGCQDEQIIFQILMNFMAHNESNKVLLQTILALPFTQDFKGSMEISQRMVQRAKSLDVATMIRCLETLCAHGSGKERLKLLRMCVLNGESQIAVTAVLNSMLLLNDAHIKLKDINQYILNVGLSSTKVEIHEALARVLGQIACVSSGKAKISKSPNSREWTIHCEHCTENIKRNVELDVRRYPPTVYDHVFNTYLKLLTSTNDPVRLNISKSILSLSNHVKSFNTNEVAKKWLPYIHDNDVEIRSNIASVIGRLLSNRISISESANAHLPDTVPDDLDEFVDLVIDEIANTLATALGTSNYSLHDTLLVTAKNFVCVPLHLTERRILNAFLITILHPNSSPVAVASATVAFQDVADFLDISPKVLYVRYRKNFLQIIMERAVSNYISFSYNIATTVHRVAKCIGYEGSRQLLRKDGHYAICFLIACIVDEPKAHELFYDIAELISMDVKQMLEEYFPYICSHAFLGTSVRVTTETLKLVMKLTGFSLAQLTKQSFMGIFEELMLHFYESPEKIVGFLEIISEYDNNQKGNFRTQEQVASYLNLRLHGILVNFDIKLGPKSDEHTQQSALASLAVLIRYMGAAYLTPLRYKILATLRTSLGFNRPGFPRLVCDAWDAFIHNITFEDLGPLFPTICVSLMQLQKTFPERVNKMLEFLIVRSNEGDNSHISELFFIDDIEVPTHISDIVKAHILQAKPEGFNVNLKLWLRRITHETDEVRVRALKYLQTFLEEHRSELNSMILSETDVHPLIVELLDILLIGCQDKDESIRLRYGECLGELGAIEPSLLPRRIISREDSNFISDMNEEFACALLVEHVRAFQMQKNSQSMDCFSLAIQEILRAYDISPQGRNSELWNNLPSTMQQIIIPFLTSHYKIVTVSDDNEFPHPIYGSEAGSSVENWAYNWLCSMSSAVRDTTLNNVLQACKLAFKRDIKTLIFCLPYIVSYIIANDQEEDYVKLREEMLAVINVRDKPVLDPVLLRHQPLRYGQSVKADNNRISEETKRTRCSRVVFCILDHLQRWLREQRLIQDSRYEAIKKFCSSLDSLVVAEGCYQSREYHRALMYLEQHMAFSNKGLSESIEGGLLAKIYAQLDEPDGVSGILVTQDQSPTLQQLVLAHEVNGQLQDAATCYERLAQKKDLKHTYLQGMIQCYVDLDQPFTAKHITEGLLSNRPELEPLITEHELFWRLAHFSRFEESSQKNIKHVLLDDLVKGIKPDLLSLKKNLVSLLEDTSRPGAYQQSYSYIMKLHILNEFDKATSMMLNNAEDLPAMLEEWENRGQLLRASRGVEFVLSMRRAILDLAVQLQGKTRNTENSMLKQEIGKIWLKSAKIARKAGLYQRAYMHILSASDSCPPQPLYIEQAQLYWQKGCQEDAFTTLKRSFSNCFQPVQYYKQLPSEQCNEERKQCAKAKLLFAKYNDETLNIDTDGCILNYKEAIEVWRGWEKSWLSCAQYYENIIERMTEDDKDRNRRDLQVHMMNFYGKSLQYGCKYIHHSMPKMLTTWLDLASRAMGTSDLDPEISRLRQDRVSKMTQIMEVYHHRLPTFMWLTAFSQLVSRICHPSPQVQNTLCTILVKLISAYPQHCLWMMASVFNSSYPTRQKRCQEILNNAQLKTPEMSKLIRDFHRLWERLIELSNKTIPDGMLNTTMNHLSRNLPRLLVSKDFSPIMIPTTKFRQLHLPSKNGSIEDHNPFLLRWVHIAKIEENVVIMPSLQRPRRITLRGSDGKRYLFMCKPKDDLRKDFRLMEFNDIVNKYLQNDPESRQRRLYIRTYSVVPLNEECGLIEWVPNLVGLRPTLNNLYREKGIAVPHKEFKTMLCEMDSLKEHPLEKKRQMYLEKLLPRHPPIFGDWFRIMFPDPYGWYEARTAYIRTTAVMSMVGYILGLGDRHGENILFDSKCGDCVHVDFNCLFNRGELFDWPERVPFRLTHNMVDAMGPLKIEGPFRRACQITMRVLRQESSTLLSVLTPFVYDPLVSWNKNQLGEAAEKTNEKAVEHIKNIEQRLKGLIRYPGRKAENIALHLSVEGQTNHLILEATSVDNLCQMYCGWGAFL